MKKTLILLLSVLFLACNGQIQIGGLTDPEDSVCAEDEYQESWICAAAAKHNLTPEDLHGIILDAVALTIIVSDLPENDIIEIKNFLIDVKKYANVHMISWNRFLDMVIEDSAKSAAIASILNRRIIIFESDDIIQEVDREMIAYHLDEILKLLG
jgi:hypothetical protein